jgi:hypothetical protein
MGRGKVDEFSTKDIVAQNISTNIALDAHRASSSAAVPPTINTEESYQPRINLSLPEIAKQDPNSPFMGALDAVRCVAFLSSCRFLRCHS